VFIPAPATGVVPKRWTRDEFYVLCEQGHFHDQRVELIGGEIIVRPPQSPEHYLTIELIRALFASCFGPGYWIRTQGPLPVGRYSDPEPDISVIQGSPVDFATAHPSTSLLAVEVSCTTQTYDKYTKASLYASAGIQDYWMVDLPARTLTVFREPIADNTQPFKYRYHASQAFDETASVSPLAIPEIAIRVSQILPPT
jgi:Uma2 family endonuclease